MLENVEEGDDDVVLMITKGNITALKQHLDENPDCIEKAVDWVGDNPLLLAVWYQQEAIVTMLLNDYDANVNVKNVNKTTPIHRACQLNDLHLVQLLLDKGADYRLTDINGKKCIELTEVNEATKQLVVAKMELDREVIENALKLSESLDKQFDEEQLELQKYQHNKKIAKRQAGAVSVVVNGAKNESVNGPYDPINKIVNDWVVYRHRANSTIYIVYVVNSWLIVECSDVEALDNIVYSTDDGNATCINYKVIVRLLCESPTHPELRIEGNNGLIHQVFFIHNSSTNFITCGRYHGIH